MADEHNLDGFGPMSPIAQATLKELEAMAISPRPDDTWRQCGNGPVFLHSRSPSPAPDPMPNGSSGDARSAFAASGTPPSQAGQPPPRNLGAYPQFHSTRTGFGGITGEGFGLSRDTRAGTWNGQLTIELPFDSLMPGLLSPVAGDLHSCLLSPTTGLLANLLSPSDFMNSSPAGEPPGSAAALVNRTSGSPLSFPPTGASEGVSVSPGVMAPRFDRQTTASLIPGGTIAVPPPALEPAMLPTAATALPITERQSTSGNPTPFNASRASNSGAPVGVLSNHGISATSAQSSDDRLERRVSSVILEMALNGVFTNGQPGHDQQAEDSTLVSDQATPGHTHQRQLPSVDVQSAPAVDEHMIQMIMGHLGQLGQPLPPLQQQQQQQLGGSSQPGRPSIQVVDLAPLESQLGAGPMPITPGMMSFNWCPPSPMPAYNKTEYQLNKRPRPGKLELTFEAYEKRYKLPAARCSSGTCADHCNMPCELHTCKCCKKHRYLDIEGVAKNRRYCGFCLRREKVDGLEFVKCCHVAMVDGVPQQCNAQMLKDAFDYHWNQHKSDLPPAFQAVDTDEGRKCGTCTNMRPVTYYSRSDTNCSCSHCQSSRTTGKKGASKAGTSSGAGVRAKRLSTPGLSTPGLSGLTGTTLGASGDVDGTGDSVWRRKSYTDISDLSNMKGGISGTPSYVEQLTGGTDPATPSYAALMEGGGSLSDPFANTQMMPGEPFTPPQFPTFGMGAAYDSTPSSRQNTANKLSPFPSYNGGGFSNSGTPSMTKSLPADLLDGPTLIQQAQALASTSLGSAVSSAPSFRVLLGKWNESRFQPGPAQTALCNMIRATRELEREAQLVVGAASETEVKELLAQGNGLMNNPL